MFFDRNGSSTHDVHTQNPKIHISPKNPKKITVHLQGSGAPSTRTNCLGNKKNASKEALNTNNYEALTQQVGRTPYVGSHEGGWPGYWISRFPKSTFHPKTPKLLPCTSSGAALQTRVPIDLKPTKYIQRGLKHP